MKTRLLAGVLLTLGLLIAAPASARVIQAETILPPGQSGFVGPDGQSPHGQDQLSLFEKLIFKSEPLGGGSGGTTPSEPRPGVTIRRDDFGVPAITATNESDLWWGVGYAVAQDRLGELELFRRRGAGTLAEVLGKGSLEDDVIARRDYYTDSELMAMFQKLPATLRARTQAYVDGVNAWITHVRQTPADMPNEFSLLKVPLNDWTLLDSLRIGVLLARTIPSGDGNELANLAALRKLGAKRFAQYLPLRVGGEIPTIPARAGSFPSRPGRTRAQEKTAFARSQLWLKKVPLPKAPSPAEAARIPTGFERTAHAIDVGLGKPGGSFMWAIRRASDSHTFFFNGPQLGYQSPNTFVEFDLTAPGVNLHTATAPGVPVNSNGYNEHVAWGVTSGLSDDDDLYVEKLAGKERYRFKGKVVKMSCRNETFKYAEGQAMKSVNRRLCRTVHGPVQATARGYVFARRYAIWGHELETLEALANIGAATSVQDVDEALLKTTWTENILAADDQGHIGYWHPGLYPLRNVSWDERLPLPGDGSAEWNGLLPRKKDPRVIDPPGQNWLVNWNNTPAKGWTYGDAPAREQLRGSFHRVALLQQLVSAAAKDPSSFDAGTIAVVRNLSSIATQRAVAQKLLARAAKGANGPAADVLNTLLAWDGNFTRTAEDGTLEPAVDTWKVFKAEAEKVMFGKLSPALEGLFEKPGSEGFIESTYGETLALRKLSPAKLQKAAADAAAALTATYGSPDPSKWRLKRPTVSAEVQGLAPAPPTPLQNRGTYEMAVELGG
ncbi:MAG TPA: penicillin acylase family protein [Thermoleophilaceae bacterium]